eukprot:1556359-Rhodomonas_salina.1
MADRKTRRVQGRRKGGKEERRKKGRREEEGRGRREEGREESTGFILSYLHFSRRSRISSLCSRSEAGCSRVAIVSIISIAALRVFHSECEHAFLIRGMWLGSRGWKPSGHTSTMLAMAIRSCGRPLK